MREERLNGARTAEISAVRVPRDAVVGLCILAFCAIAYGITLTFKDAPPALAQNVQPATFPRLVIGVMAVLAIVVIAQSFGKEERKLSRIPVMIPISGCVMIAFVLGFQWLGFVPAMMILCIGLPVLWGERRWHMIIPFAVLLPAAIYLLFAAVLGVYFEPSPLWPW